jgi:hypothetical protein
VLQFHRLFLLAALVSAPAAAERWVDLGADEDSTVASIDLDSIQTSGSMRTFMAKYVIPKIPEIDHTLIRQRIDCSARTIDQLHLTAYDKKGTVMLDEDDTEPAHPISAGSKGDDMLMRVCA